VPGPYVFEGFAMEARDQQGQQVAWGHGILSLKNGRQ
jgi:hypothetical protein